MLYEKKVCLNYLCYAWNKAFLTPNCKCTTNCLNKLTLAADTFHSLIWKVFFSWNFVISPHHCFEKKNSAREFVHDMSETTSSNLWNINWIIRWKFSIYTHKKLCFWSRVWKRVSILKWKKISWTALLKQAPCFKPWPEAKKYTQRKQFNQFLLKFLLKLRIHLVWNYPELFEERKTFKLKLN